MPSDGSPALSVVVVSWNTCDLLRDCLAAVARERDLPHEVIVVDNASADGSADMVAVEFPAVTLVRNRDNRGFGTACNQGAARARGRHVIFLNPDAEPTPGSLARLVEFLDRHADVGVVGPLMVGGEDGAPGLTYGYEPSVTTALLPLLRPLAALLPGRGDLHALGVVPGPPADDAGPMDVDYVCGAALTVRRAAFEAIGGFDEAFFLYFEETDLCRRVRAGGFRVVYLPGVRVAHREGASRDKRSAPAVAEFYRSLDRYLNKHHGPGYVALVRGAMIASFLIRYLVARLAARPSLASHYLASARALRADGHA